jgi:hypothetical protein
MYPHELASYVEANIPEFENGGIGIYPSWVHVDLGPRRRWLAGPILPFEQGRLPL